MDSKRSVIHNDLSRRLSERGICFKPSSRSLEKSGLVSCHNAAALEFKRMVDEIGPSERREFTYYLLDPKEPTAALSSLEELNLCDLHKNVRKHANRVCCQTGKVVRGKFCVKPFITVGVHTVFEDGSGRAVLVVIDNAIRTTASEEEVWKTYPEGMEVAIKEPVFRQLWMDGTVGFHVANPADIVPIGHSAFPDTQLLNSLEQAGPVRLVESADACRLRGNSFFREKQWSMAVKAYMLSASILEGYKQRMDIFVTTGISPDPKVIDEKLIVIYSNWSEACLRLRSYKKALANAEKSLQLNPRHDKALMRKAKSLQGMQRFEEAIACLDLLQSLQSPNTSQQDILCRKRSVETAARQSGSGIYELDDFIQICEGSKDAPDCAQFVGPVRIGTSSESGRRGMFATRDIQPGELLLVSKALALGKEAETGPRILIGHGVMVPKVDEPAPTSGQYLTAWGESLHNVVVEMIARAQESPQYANQVNSLQGSHTKQDLPPLSLFTEDWDDEKYAEVIVTIRHIRDIANNNDFGGDGSSILYGLASFFNHSCAPNCHYSNQIGDVIFISSARKIRAGEELCISYFEIFRSIFFRMKSTQRRPIPFQCDCPRCKFEEQAFREIPTLAALALCCNDMLEPETEPGLEVRASVLIRSAILSKSIDIAGKLEKILKTRRCAQFSQQHKDWIRCSFAICYLNPYLIEGHVSQLHLSVDDIVRVLSSVNPGHEAIMRFLVNGFTGELNNIKLERNASTVHFARLLMEQAARIYLPVKDKSLETVCKWNWHICGSLYDEATGVVQM